MTEIDEILRDLDELERSLLVATYTSYEQVLKNYGPARAVRKSHHLYEAAPDEDTLMRLIKKGLLDWVQRRKYCIAIPLGLKVGKALCDLEAAERVLGNLR